MTDSPRNSRVSAVVFDLDGTLYSLRAMKLRMTLALLDSLHFLRRLGSARAEVRRKSYPDAKELLSAMYGALADASGRSPAEAEQWYQQRFRRAFVELLARRAKVRDDLPGLLTDLRKRGVRVAVLSDFGWVSERLEALNIDLSLFDTIASTEDFGALKPSPVSMIALARSWKVNPQEVLVVGDRHDLDQAAADAAGMQFAGIAGSSSGGQAEFGSWKQVLARIGAGTDSEQAE